MAPGPVLGNRGRFRPVPVVLATNGAAHSTTCRSPGAGVTLLASGFRGEEAWEGRNRLLSFYALQRAPCPCSWFVCIWRQWLNGSVVSALNYAYFRPRLVPEPGRRGEQEWEADVPLLCRGAGVVSVQPGLRKLVSLGLIAPHGPQLAASLPAFPGLERGGVSRGPLPHAWMLLANPSLLFWSVLSSLSTAFQPAAPNLHTSHGLWDPVQASPVRLE